MLKDPTEPGGFPVERLVLHMKKLETARLLALFLLTYIWLDGSGMRPAWFFYARFFASLSASYVLSLLAIVYFSINDR